MARNRLDFGAQAFSKVLYERTQTAPGAEAAAEAPAQGGDEDAIDAEFEVKKD